MKANTNLVTNESCSALHWAAVHCDVEVTLKKNFLQLPWVGPNLFAITKGGTQAFLQSPWVGPNLFAITMGGTQVFLQLLWVGPNLFAITMIGTQVQVVKWLVRTGARVNHSSVWGETALHLLFKRKGYSENIFPLAGTVFLKVLPRKANKLQYLDIS